MLKLRKNKKGFTLVELIVVIAIMAILAGTVTGVVVSTQQNAKNSAAESGAKSLANQLVLLLGNPSDPDTTLVTVTAPTSSTKPTCTFDAGDIITTISADPDYKDTVVATAQKAGTNKYQLTAAKLAFTYDTTDVNKIATVAEATTGTDVIMVTFDELGSGNKTVNKFYIYMDYVNDQFVVFEGAK